jgi:Flp pilus assembly protein TadB
VNALRAFLSDRLNATWLVSGVVLVVMLILVPNDGVGTPLLIVAAVVTIGLTGAIRIRDARRDRADRERRGGHPGRLP